MVFLKIFHGYINSRITQGFVIRWNASFPSNVKNKKRNNWIASYLDRWCQLGNDTYDKKCDCCSFIVISQWLFMQYVFLVDQYDIPELVCNIHDWWLLLTRKMQKRGCPFLIFYGHRQWLVDSAGISVLRITAFMFQLWWPRFCLLFFCDMTLSDLSRKLSLLHFCIFAMTV